MALNQVRHWTGQDSQEDHLQYYKLLTDVHLRNTELPIDAIMCGNINCKNVSHNNDLCAMYDKIVNCLVDGSEPLRRKVVK